MPGIAARLRPPTWVQDILLAVFITLFQVRGTLLVGPPDARSLTDPGYLGYGLLVATGLALVVRRRWPVAVFAGLGVASTVYYAFGYPDGPTWAALFVAAYTLTERGDGNRSVKIAVGGLAALTVGWLLTANLVPLIHAGWVFFRIGAVCLHATLGESVRTRRVLAAEAQERAERAERTKEEEARRRVDAERLRIAREVHDTVAHAIGVINVQAGVTAHVLDRKPDQSREALRTIEQTSARALQELRGTLGMLRDVADDRTAPTPGLDRMGELVSVARGAGLDVTVDSPPSVGELPSAVDHAAYRIIQESITNVIRHAGPAAVSITIEYGAAGLTVHVTDDGRGGNTPASTGQGIAGMRERVALLGGQLDAGPRPAGGFQVRARLPLEPELAAHE